MFATAPQDDYLPAMLEHIAGAAGPEVIRILKTAASAHAGDPRPLLLLAAEFMQDGSQDEAEAAYILALARSPDFAIARFQLGLLQFTSGRPVTAAATWQAFSALPDSNEFYCFRLGMVHLAADDFAVAQEWIAKGMQANTTNRALNRDMQRLLDRMPGATPAAPVAQAAATIAAALPPVASEETSGHFLLSSYRNLH